MKKNTKDSETKKDKEKRSILKRCLGTFKVIGILLVVLFALIKVSAIVLAQRCKKSDVENEEV